MCKQWCYDIKPAHQATGNPLTKWSDESSFTLPPTSGRVYAQITPKEAYNPEGLVPTVKHKGGSLMVWAAISWNPAGPMITFHGRTTARDKLGNQVHSSIQTLFPKNDAVFHDDNASIHKAGSVQSWIEEHDGKLQNLPGPSRSSVLNIIEQL
jgi:hypothetical protein